MQQPQIIKGNLHKDERGILKYNNDFDLSQIKRFYTIEPSKPNNKRGWRGHKIEQRWFTAIKGTFKIHTIAVDNWEIPNKDLVPKIFTLSAETLDILHIPAGCITCIQAQEENAILAVFADYELGALNDEYRYDLNHFKSAKIYENPLD